MAGPICVRADQNVAASCTLRCSDSAIPQLISVPGMQLAQLRHSLADPDGREGIEKKKLLWRKGSDHPT